MVPRFARAVLRSGSSGSGLTWLRPHMTLVIDHVRVTQRVAGPEAKNRTRKAGNHEPTASQMVFVGTRFSIGLQMQPGKSSRTTGWKNAFPHV